MSAYSPVADDHWRIPGRSEGTQGVDVRRFLIADVRGYTTFTQERWDEDAARLAGRLAEVMRSVVDHRGRVLGLRGDEAMAVFGSPRPRFGGTVALQQRFVEEPIADPSPPLPVGIGLDAGEAVAVEAATGAGALNLAATALLARTRGRGARELGARPPRAAG